MLAAGWIRALFVLRPTHAHCIYIINLSLSGADKVSSKRAEVVSERSKADAVTLDRQKTQIEQLGEQLKQVLLTSTSHDVTATNHVSSTLYKTYDKLAIGIPEQQVDISSLTPLK